MTDYKNVTPSYNHDLLAMTGQIEIIAALLQN